MRRADVFPGGFAGRQTAPRCRQRHLGPPALEPTNRVNQLPPARLGQCLWDRAYGRRQLHLHGRHLARLPHASRMIHQASANRPWPNLADDAEPMVSPALK